MKWLMARFYLVVAALCFFLFAASVGHCQTDFNPVPSTRVGFQTQDGWTIRGTLLLPSPLPSYGVPGVVLVAEPGWLDATAYDIFLALELRKLGIATLAIDPRGTGRTLGKKDFRDLSPKEEAEAMQLDIKAAVEYLAANKNVDPKRIGIVGAGVSANYTVLEASANAAVRAIGLISASLGPQAQDLIREGNAGGTRKDLPILFLVDQKDSLSFQQTADAYSHSENPDSGLIFAPGHGTNIFTHSNDAYLLMAKWFAHNLGGLGIESAVSFKSTDGWTLRGTLRIPQVATKSTPVAGVVMTHGCRHDERTWSYLSEALAKDDIAVLTYSWRAKGASADDDHMRPFDTAVKGNESGALDTSHDPNRNNVLFDVKAAVDFLASQKGVDSSRIGLIGATCGAQHSLEAAVGDARIKTLVLLSGGSYLSDPKVKAYVTTTDVPILAVDALDDDPTGSNLKLGKDELTGAAKSISNLILASKSKESQMLIYSHGGHGSEILQVQPELEPTILRWFTEKLDSAWLKQHGRAN